MVKAVEATALGFGFSGNRTRTTRQEGSLEIVVGPDGPTVIPAVSALFLVNRTYEITGPYHQILPGIRPIFGR